MVAIPIVLVVYLFEALRNPHTSISQYIRFYLDMPTMPEFMLGNLSPDILPNSIPLCNSSMSSQEFIFNHISKTVPCIFEGEAKTWPAYDKWKDKAYLNDTAGD